MRRFLLLICGFGYVLAATGLVAAPQTLYQATNPGPLIGFSNMDEQAVLYDDIPIPLARFPGATSFSVTRMTVSLFAPNPGVYHPVAWVARPVLVNGQIAPDSPTTTKVLPDAIFAQDGTVPRDFVVGDGTAELFQIPLDRIVTLRNGDKYKLFFFGLSFDRPLNNIGWVAANGPDFNINGFYKYYGIADGRTGPGSMGQPYWPGYSLILEGDPLGIPVPEPSSLLLLAGYTGMILCQNIRRTS